MLQAARFRHLHVIVVIGGCEAPRAAQAPGLAPAPAPAPAARTANPSATAAQAMQRAMMATLNFPAPPPQWHCVTTAREAAAAVRAISDVRAKGVVRRAWREGGPAAAAAAAGDVASGRPWLRADERPQEAFLAAFPSLNAVSAQRVLAACGSLRGALCLPLGDKQARLGPWHVGAGELALVHEVANAEHRPQCAAGMGEDDGPEGAGAPGGR